MKPPKRNPRGFRWIFVRIPNSRNLRGISNGVDGRRAARLSEWATYCGMKRKRKSSGYVSSGLSGIFVEESNRLKQEREANEWLGDALLYERLLWSFSTAYLTKFRNTHPHDQASESDVLRACKLICDTAKRKTKRLADLTEAVFGALASQPHPISGAYDSSFYHIDEILDRLLSSPEVISLAVSLRANPPKRGVDLPQKSREINSFAALEGLLPTDFGANPCRRSETKNCSLLPEAVLQNPPPPPKKRTTPSLEKGRLGGEVGSGTLISEKLGRVWREAVVCATKAKMGGFRREYGRVALEAAVSEWLYRGYGDPKHNNKTPGGMTTARQIAMRNEKINRAFVDMEECCGRTHVKVGKEMSSLLFTTIGSLHFPEECKKPSTSVQISAALTSVVGLFCLLGQNHEKDRWNERILRTFGQLYTNYRESPLASFLTYSRHKTWPGLLKAGADIVSIISSASRLPSLSPARNSKKFKNSKIKFKNSKSLENSESSRKRWERRRLKMSAGGLRLLKRVGCDPGALALDALLRHLANFLKTQPDGTVGNPGNYESGDQVEIPGDLLEILDIPTVSEPPVCVWMGGNKMVVGLEDGFQRKLLHTLCEFYSIPSATALLPRDRDTATDPDQEPDIILLSSGKKRRKRSGDIGGSRKAVQLSLTEGCVSRLLETQKQSAGEQIASMFSTS
ncbi:hypothetical protein AAMO2058_001161900 [Amorphochlora amoebiformis]